MRGNQEIEGQMDTLWRHVEPITIAGRGPGECLPRAAQQLAAAEAAQGRAQRVLADAGAAPRAIGSPAAIKQAAEAAARKAENAGTFADDYLGRADVAAADAQNCVAVAEDFARKAATTAATTSGTSAGSTSGTPAVGSGNVEQDPRLIAECAARFPGSVPVWDAANNRAACRCPDGSAPNAAGSACIDCAAIEANFAAAFNAGDLNSAQGWLAEGGRCAWAGRAQAALANATRQQQQADLSRQQRELDCLRLETNIMGALNARNLGAAQGLLAQAMAMGCTVSGQTQLAVQEAIRREQRIARDQQQQQALAQFAQNWQRMLEGMQRQPVPPPGLGSPPPSTPAPTLSPRQAAPGPQAGARQGPYVPSNMGQPCADLGQQAEGRCKQMVDQCKQRNCAGGGYSGCAVDCPGCGNFDGFIAWCALHPSYRPMVSAGLSAHLNEIQGCIQRFLADNQPGRRERAAACQRESQGRLDASFKQWIAQTCQARCSQDGRRGTIKVMPHRCECE
jgi:hypothetical protein